MSQNYILIFLLVTHYFYIIFPIILINNHMHFYTNYLCQYQYNYYNLSLYYLINHFFVKSILSNIHQNFLYSLIYIIIIIFDFFHLNIYSFIFNIEFNNLSIYCFAYFIFYFTIYTKIIYYHYHLYYYY